MNKYPFAVLLILILICSTCQTRRSSSPTTAWQTYRCNMQHSGWYAGKGPTGKPVLKWKKKGLGVAYQYQNLAVVAGGTLYTISSHLQGLCAVDIHSGTPQWEKGPSGFISSITLSGEHLFFGCNDGYLYVVNRHTGETEWNFHTGRSFYCAPVVAHGSVWFATEEGHVYAVNLKEQRLSWEEQFKMEPGGYTPLLTLSDEILLVTIPYQEEGTLLYAVEAATGKVRWKLSDRNLSLPVTRNGTVFLVRDRKTLVALEDRTGKEIWTYSPVSGISAPLIAPGTLYLFSDSSNLVALDSRNGKVRWKIPTEGSHQLLAVTSTMLFYTAGDPSLCIHAFDLQAKKSVWKYEYLDLSNIPAGSSPDGEVEMEEEEIPVLGDFLLGEGMIFYALESGWGDSRVFDLYALGE